MYLTKLYERTLSFCKKKNSKYILYFISFIESIFLPFPTDPFMIPFIIAEKKIFKLVFFTTFFSALGGVAAYLVGHFLWNIIQFDIISIYPKVEELLEKFNDDFSKFGILLILIGGLSPFPYKITCLASGILGINIFIFAILSFVSRGTRFLIFAFFILKYGDKSIRFFKKYILLISLIVLIIFIILLI